MKKAGIFLILLAFLCVGQGFGPKIVKGPTPAASSAWDGTPQMLPGISHRWVYTNGIVLDTSRTPAPGRITNWTALFGVDTPHQILAHFDTNITTVTHWPTNVTTQGVYFDGFNEGHSLSLPTDYEVTNNASMSVCMILSARRWNYATVPLLFPKILGSCNIYTRSSDSNIVVDARDLGSTTHLTTFGPLTNGLADFVVCFSNSVGGGGAIGYINGVLKTNYQHADLTSIYTKWGQLGFDGASYYEGWIREVMFFTNVVTSVTASNIHWYRTNLYGGVP